MKNIFYYFKIWWMMSRNAFLVTASKKRVIFIFLFTKILRFVFFFGFLYYLLQSTRTLAGYTQLQAIFFFLTFNVVDVIPQFLFREVYRFRPQIISGDFDLALVKPVNALFRVLMGGADIIDLILLVPLIIITFYVGSLLGPTGAQVLLYFILILNALIIATAFHIAVLSLGIITFEIDHTILIYRDLTNLGRLPIDIYRQPLQGFLTYLVPVGMMITFPAKALMGLLSPWSALASLFFALIAIILSLRFWKFALKKYSSASS